MVLRFMAAEYRLLLRYAVIDRLGAEKRPGSSYTHVICFVAAF